MPMPAGPSRPQAWMSWSSGKDSALALHEVRTTGAVEVVALLTSVNVETERVAMHGVRRSLLEAQALALDLPLHMVELPWPCPNATYEQQMNEALRTARSGGVEAMVFGDLFLDDIRRYREASLLGSGITPLFPLWQRPTSALAQDLIEQGFRALVVCVDLAQAPSSLAGRWFDHSLLAELPPGVDPCGENGEFHTVVVDGPGFAHSIDVVVGETIERDGFAFTDVLPTKESSARR
ncbi:MAG TPA: hypothetical protein VGG38_10060 [Acidimicrobiales bacterium]